MAILQQLNDQVLLKLNWVSKEVPAPSSKIVLSFLRYTSRSEVASFEFTINFTECDIYETQTIPSDIRRFSRSLFELIFRSFFFHNISATRNMFNNNMNNESAVKFITWKLCPSSGSEKDWFWPLFIALTSVTLKLTYQKLNPFFKNKIRQQTKWLYIFLDFWQPFTGTLI